jgi:hypothetical protein
MISSTMVEQSHENSTKQVRFTYTLGVLNDGGYRKLRLIKNTERVKYCHPEYSDGEIDGLMKYFRFETYREFLDFLRNNNRE